MVVRLADIDNQLSRGNGNGYMLQATLNILIATGYEPSAPLRLPADR